jgi:single-strand DNA-binding protein
MNINRVVITGNLTADPELRNLQSGASVCRLRLASNTRRKQADGSWAEKPNYFDVTVWGAQGESVSRYLHRGSAVAIDGRLEWREWSTDAGDKRQAVEIIAESVQFLGGASEERTAPPSTGSRESEGGGPPAGDDEIPF